MNSDPLLAEIRIRLRADGKLELNMTAGCTKVMVLGMLELAKLSLVAGKPEPEAGSRIVVPQIGPMPS